MWECERTTSCRAAVTVVLSTVCPCDHVRWCVCAAAPASGIGHQIELIAKLEAYDCLQHLDAIVQAADGIMVARGDLGAQVRVIWEGGGTVPWWAVTDLLERVRACISQ